MHSKLVAGFHRWNAACGNDAFFSLEPKLSGVKHGIPCSASYFHDGELRAQRERERRSGFPCAFKLMPTILDRRASYQSQQQQTSPLSSPSLTPQNQQSLQQQQNRFWDDDQADPEHGPESRFTNVEFSPAASKSPASSRVHRSGETASLANAECSPTSCSPSSTAAVAATAATAQPPPPPAASKRRSASVTLKNGATVKLPSKPADPLLNKEQCSINPSSVSSNSICQHFPCHMKQSTATTKHSSSSSNASPYHNNSKKSNAVSANNPGIGPLGSVPGNATSTAIERRSRSLRSQRKRLIKEAKSEYEERVEMYCQQLTVGCGHVSCQNRFCASSKGNKSFLE